MLNAMAILLNTGMFLVLVLKIQVLVEMYHIAYWVELIFILMYIMNTNTAQIYTPLLVFLSSFTVTIAPPLCGLRQGSPVGPFTSAPVFQPPHGFLGLFLKFSVKTLLLTYKFFCSKLRSIIIHKQLRPAILKE